MSRFHGQTLRESSIGREESVKTHSAEECVSWKSPMLMGLVVDADRDGHHEFKEDFPLLAVASCTGDESHRMFRFMCGAVLTSRHKMELDVEGSVREWRSDVGHSASKYSLK